jgi:plastocyanin domain-containing protein
MNGVMGFMLLIDIVALGAVAFIVWWFWLHKPRSTSARSTTGDAVEIVVADGVYSPAHIEVPAGQAVILRFLRRDPAPCAEQVQFPDLGVSAELPLGKTVEVSVPALEAGDYGFSCQMQMYRGTLSVK